MELPPFEMNNSIPPSLCKPQPHPIYHGLYSDKIKNVLHIIAEGHLANGDLLNNNGLLNGRMGLALFYYYYYEYTQNEKYAEIGGKLVTEAVENIVSSKTINPYLANGLTGILWGLNILYQRGYLADPPMEIFSIETYNYLETVAYRAVALENNDYLFGSLGIIAFLNSEDWDVTGLLAEIMKNKALQKPIRRSKKMLTSLSYKDNLTLAHGEAGFLAVLRQVSKKGKNIEKVRIMIEQVCCKLMTIITTTRRDSLFFPDFFNDSFNYDRRPSSKLAWSTGELSISYNLLDALEYLGENVLASKISEHVKQCASYTTDKNSAQDIFFCQGSIGYTYLFHKLRQKFELNNLSTAIDYWLKTILDYYGDRTSSLDSYRSNFPSTLRFGILNGSSGVGLGLMGIASGEASDKCWDKILLL
ncbi:hypothetical protein GCM10011386_30450 [Parapedobacter defluvii]|uniref:Lanthionine synthetase C-like protein n=1 Tax=Parapedobacter defluvii TaxID=2045106 RepID=A0ABQ1M7W3_9SPHI|nr:lanthionine synthetase LanC family protein [Parapedobacter defluvii]GGC36222.1 hypothetical protein GCM10011386_30450 [Parapedobacter defluvii]